MIPKNVLSIVSPYDCSRPAPEVGDLHDSWCPIRNSKPYRVRVGATRTVATPARLGLASLSQPKHEYHGGVADLAQLWRARNAHPRVAVLPGHGASAAQARSQS
jgi:hypothetical protein